MTSPQPPRPAPPVTAQTLVADAMAALDGVEELPPAEQLARLEEAQTVLAAVLDNPAHAQGTIPGVRPGR